MQSITVLGTSEKINEQLASYCSDLYVGGTTGAANLEWLKDMGWDFIQFESGHYCNTARFVAPVADSAQFGIFLEALAGLEAYPLFSDEYLSDLQMKLEEQEWEELISEHKLDRDVFWDVVSEGDYYWEDDGMADNYGMHANFDIEEFVALVIEKSQTWKAHYYSGLAHEPEVCKYCADAKADVEVVNV